MGEQLAFYNLLGLSFIGSMIWAVAIMKKNWIWMAVGALSMLGGAVGTSFVLLYYFDALYKQFWLCTIVWPVMVASILYGVIKVFLIRKQNNQAN